MDVRLSPEQQALRDSVGRVVAQLGPKTVADLDDRERVAKLDAAAGAAGWRELRSDSGDGAPWASGVEAALVAEELGRGVADTPFIGPLLAGDLRRQTGSDGDAARETVAFTADLSTLGVDVAVDAAGAEAALSSGGRVAVLEEVSSVDLTRPSAAVADPAADLGTGDLVRWTALGLAVTSADLVGAMRGAIELSTEYAKARRQYGAPIGSFQAVQHLIADAYVSMEGARSIVLHAAWAVDALSPDEALAAAAGAKAYASRAARSACETAIQVHGGIGNTWEHMAHVFLRRVLLSTALFGGVGPNLSRVLAHRGVDGLL